MISYKCDFSCVWIFEVWTKTISKESINFFPLGTIWKWNPGIFRLQDDLISGFSTLQITRMQNFNLLCSHANVCTLIYHDVLHVCHYEVSSDGLMADKIINCSSSQKVAFLSNILCQCIMTFCHTLIKAVYLPNVKNSQQKFVNVELFLWARHLWFNEISKSSYTIKNIVHENTKLEAKKILKNPDFLIYASIWIELFHSFSSDILNYTSIFLISHWKLRHLFFYKTNLSKDSQMFWF